MKNIIAIDLGGSKLIVALVSPEGKILAQNRQEILNTTYTKEVIRQRISIGVRELEVQVGNLDAVAVGISIPGPCDPIRGIFIHNFTTKIDNWSIADDIKSDIGLPVFIDNDVNACAVGEKVFGRCKYESDYLWMTVSFGCGGALFLDNKLYRGKNFLAGEIGHIQVEYNNPRLCGCGQLGDMESEGAGIAIGAKYLKRTGQKENPTFHSKHVSELAHQGDEIALQIFQESGFYIGKLCATVSKILNIPLAVIGGGVAVYDYDLLKPGIDMALDKFVFPMSKGKFSVVQTSLGYNASLLGAATLTFFGN